MAKAPALPAGFELPLKQRLPRIGAIDQVGVEERAAELAKRSIKKESKLWALELAIRCCDLTTLEGQDTPGKVAALCSKAIRPDPTDPNVPVGRGGLRLPEPRRRPRSSGSRAAASRSPRSRRRSRPARARSTSRCARSRRPSRSAPTRSTW